MKHTKNAETAAKRF